MLTEAISNITRTPSEVRIARPEELLKGAGRIGLHEVSKFRIKSLDVRLIDVHQRRPYRTAVALRKKDRNVLCLLLRTELASGEYYVATAIDWLYCRKSIPAYAKLAIVKVHDDLFLDVVVMSNHVYGRNSVARVPQALQAGLAVATPRAITATSAQSKCAQW